MGTSNSKAASRLRVSFSLAGLLIGMVGAGLLVWPQMRPKRKVDALVGMREIDVSVHYHWGWPFVYRVSRSFERYGQLPEDRWAEYYPDSLGWRIEDLKKRFPDYDIEGWVDSRDSPALAWDLPGDWYVGGIVGDVLVVVLPSLVLALAVTRLGTWRRRATP
jgi:hypothetical protein